MTGRDRIVLDGNWSFWTDPQDVLTPELLDPATEVSLMVPAPWQAHSDALRFYSGVAWYQRTVEIPPDWQNSAVILGFGAVDYQATVWMNGQRLGSHEGGYLPFEWEVQSLLQPGTNILTVRVADLPEWFNEIPHGKQSWYGPLSGIWQSVWLEQRASLHIRTLQVIALPEREAVTFEVTLSSDVHQITDLRLSVRDAEDKIVSQLEILLNSGEPAITKTLPIATPHRWSPDSPYLYQAQVDILHDHQVMDSVTKPFGFRTIETRGGRFYLNGELLYLRGALDQDYYPDTIATPPSTHFLESQLWRAKELGLNCLRCHIKVPDPRYYDIADRMGMLIWTELPNSRLLTPAAQERAQATLQGIVERDGHHPSIIIWTIINENWGTNLLHDSDHRAWLKTMYGWLKALDPSRLVVDNSPCIGNFHVQSDIDDYHFYKAIPDQRQEWIDFVVAMATRTAPTYSPFGDAERTGEEPIVISEFGNWGLPDVEQLLEAGEEPWWFETGLEFNEVVYPHDVQKRFYRWGLEQVFGSWRHFVEATQWQQFYALKAEIEAMRRMPEIAGYVITEFTDVHWEANGLLDLRRNPKIFHHAFTKFNGETVLVPRWQRTAYWAGETLDIDWTVAHGGSEALGESIFTCGMDHRPETEMLRLPPVAAGELYGVEMPHVVSSSCDHAVSTHFWSELTTGTGDFITRNEVPIALYPAWQGPNRPALRLWCADLALSHALTRLGYHLSSTPTEAEVIVVYQVNNESLALANMGKTVVVLVQSSDALGGGTMGIHVVPRANSILQGDWVSSFAWLRRDGGFARLPCGPMLDYSFEPLMPAYVLTGFGTWEYKTNVHAGMFVGWIHKVAALLVEQAYGKGKLVLTTFRFAPESFGINPVATTLWDALLDLSPLTSQELPATNASHAPQTPIAQASS
jgi:hypothetical protein